MAARKQKFESQIEELKLRLTHYYFNESIDYYTKTDFKELFEIKSESKYTTHLVRHGFLIMFRPIDIDYQITLRNRLVIGSDRGFVILNPTKDERAYAAGFRLEKDQFSYSKVVRDKSRNTEVKLSDVDPYADTTVVWKVVPDKLDETNKNTWKAIKAQREFQKTLVTKKPPACRVCRQPFEIIRRNGKNVVRHRGKFCNEKLVELILTE